MPDRLARQICSFTQGLREGDLFKPPGMAETLDWARALLALGTQSLAPDVVDDTLGVFLKYQEDVDRMRGRRAEELVRQTTAASAT